MKDAGPGPVQWKRVLVLGAGLLALCLAIVFTGWVVIPHLRFQYHRRLLASQDKEERREAARCLARLGTEEAVRTLLMKIQSGFEEHPDTAFDSDEEEEKELSLYLPVESQLFLEAFKDVNEGALPILVDTLCSSDVRHYGAALLALLTFLEEEADSESGGDGFRTLESHGVSPALIARAQSCCQEMEEKNWVFWDEGRQPMIHSSHGRHRRGRTR